MSITSTCEALDTSLDSYLSKFNIAKATAQEYLDTLDSTISDIKDDAGIDDLVEQISSNKADALSQITDVQNIASGMTGSCLDALNSSFSDALNNINSVSNDVLSLVSDTDFTAISSAMSEVKSILDSLGIATLITKLDELLGCLGDYSDCISTDKIDTTFEVIDNFISSNNLQSDGTFDITTKLDSVDDIGDNIKQNLIDLSDNTDDISTEITSLLTSSSSKMDKTKW